MAKVDILQVGDWRKAQAILSSAPTRLKVAMEVATAQEAQLFRNKIVEGFRTQAPGGKRFRPLRPLTLAIRRFTGKRSTKALIVDGDLRNSIKAVRTGEGWFVGVLKSARSRDGRKLVDVAAVHEFGSRTFTVEVTPKMRRFLMMVISAELGGPSGGRGGLKRGILVIRIPARPFIRPVFEKWGQPALVKRRFMSRVGRLMTGDLGQVPPPSG